MCPSRFRLRRLFRGVIYFIARPLVQVGVPPNTVTFFSLLVALIAFLTLLLLQNAPLFGLLVFLTGLLDGVDGAVARLGNRASPSGPFVDSLVDKISEGLILLAVAIAFQNTIVFGVGIPVWVLLCLFSWLLTSYTRARAESLGVSDLDIGLGARSERLFTLVIFSILNFILIGLIVVTVLGSLTAAYRFYHYNRQLLERAKHSTET